MSEFVRRSPQGVRVATLLCLPLLLLVGSTSASDDLYLVAGKAVPEKPADLRILEEAAAAVATKALTCTVGVQVGPNYGSGVVISEQGLVLTAAHVTGRPGRTAEIRFTDGTTVKGKTLGMNMEADGALIQITDEGKWPFAPLVTLDNYPRPGDWCVATGHPGGFDEDRTPPVRFGRLIDVTKFILRSDCLINSGDSGGPLFDIEGRVIGIHSRISEEATVNLHGPVLEFLESWSQMKAGEIYPQVSGSRFLKKLDADGDGSITRGEQPDEIHRRIYDRLVEKYSLDADATHAIDDLVDQFQWRDVEASLQIRPYDGNAEPGHSLPRERFTRGPSVRASFAMLAESVRKSIVEVRCDDQVVALGAVVPQGVLTKASQLTGKIICKAHDGRELAASVVNTDTEHDLALLKLDASDLPAISWSDSTPALGNWVITASTEASPASLGVVSVAGRMVKSGGGVLGVAIARDSVGAVVEQVFAGSGAASAGLKANDLITHVFDQPVNGLKELIAALSKYHPGETVKTKIVRDGKEIDFEVRLGMREDIFREDERFGSGKLNGELSLRRDGFPDVIQHDSVLEPNQVGGPVLDLQGKVVAINIARADRVATYAVPCRTVQQVLERLCEQPSEETQESQE